MTERSDEERRRQLEEDEWDREFAREEDPNDLLELPPGFREELWERIHAEFPPTPRRPQRARWPWVVLGVCLALVAYFVLANRRG